MAVRAKFQISSVTPHETDQSWGSVGVQASPVWAPDDPQSENGKFWQATPSGTLQMTITNPAAFEFFKPGMKVYVTFDEAPD